MKKLITKGILLGFTCLTLLSCAKEPGLEVLNLSPQKATRAEGTRPLQIKLNRTWNNAYTLSFDTGRLYIKRILLDSEVVYDTYTDIDFSKGDPVILTSIPANYSDSINLKIEIDDSASFFVGKLTTRPKYIICYRLTQVNKFHFKGKLSGNDTIKVTFDPLNWYIRFYTPFKLWKDRSINFNYGDYPGDTTGLRCSFWSYFQLRGPWRNLTNQETRKVQTTIE